MQSNVIASQTPVIQPASFILTSPHPTPPFPGRLTYVSATKLKYSNAWWEIADT